MPSHILSPHMAWLDGAEARLHDHPELREEGGAAAEGASAKLQVRVIRLVGRVPRVEDVVLRAHGERRLPGVGNRQVVPWVLGEQRVGHVGRRVGGQDARLHGQRLLHAPGRRRFTWLVTSRLSTTRAIPPQRTVSRWPVGPVWWRLAR